MTDLSSREPASENELAEATMALHAATRAVLLHLGNSEAMDAAEAYATRVIGSYDRDIASVLEAYAAQVQMRAEQYADSLKHSFYATALARIGREDDRKRGEHTEHVEELWSQLQRPFAFSEVQLAGLKVDPVSRFGTAHPVVDAEALRSRFDEVLGPAGWHLRFESGRPVKAILSIEGATREGFGQDSNLHVACGEALRAAARLFGIARGLHGEAVVSVNVDKHGAVINAEAIRKQMLEARVIAA